MLKNFLTYIVHKKVQHDDKIKYAYIRIPVRSFPKLTECLSTFFFQYIRTDIYERIGIQKKKSISGYI